MSRAKVPLYIYTKALCKTDLQLYILIKYNVATNILFSNPLAMCRMKYIVVFVIRHKKTTFESVQVLTSIYLYIVLVTVGTYRLNVGIILFLKLIRCKRKELFDVSHTTSAYRDS